MASKLTIIVGVIFIAMSLGFYFAAGGPGEASPTALIPAGLGVLYVILGVLAGREALRKTVMHIAAVLALLTFLGGFRVMPWADEQASIRISHSAMVILGGLLLIVYVRSFIAARRAPNTRTVRKDVEEKEHGQMTLRRTTIDEIEMGGQSESSSQNPPSHHHNS